MRWDETLLTWYEDHGRDLPWRHTHEPYPILVSEVMLQQTQVARVIPFFERWMHQFPDWKTLADAAVADVIRLWSGLGYNRRALALQGIAKQVAEHGVPTTREAWRALKGIGAYTSASLTTLSGQGRVLPVDTNVRRLLGRLLLADPALDAKRDEELETLAQDVFDTTEHPDVLVQALFDLASEICTKQPTCLDCPFKAVCPMSERFLRGEMVVKRLTKPSKEKIREGKRFPDRIYRGRILRHVQEEQRVDLSRLGPNIDPGFTPEDAFWVEAMADRLVRDGLLERHENLLTLPRENP